MRDVAAEAGVSRSVAARALSGSGYVGARSRERVLEAAERLGYVQHASAVVLKERVSRCVGVLVGDLRSPFDAAVVAGVSAAAHAGGLATMVADLAGAGVDVRGALERFVAHGVGGVVVTSPSPEPVRYLRSHDVPVIEVDRRLAPWESDGVVRDHREAARLAGALLRDHGHADVVLVPADPDDVRGAEWLAGLTAALGREPRVLALGDDPRAALEGLLAGAASGVVVPTERAASVVVHGLQDAGARVPTDVSVLCLDDAPWMALWRPGLTAVTHEPSELGAAAVGLLVDRWADRTAPVRTVPVPVAVRARGSVGPVHGHRSSAA